MKKLNAMAHKNTVKSVIARMTGAAYGDIYIGSSGIATHNVRHNVYDFAYVSWVYRVDDGEWHTLIQPLNGQECFTVTGIMQWDGEKGFFGQSKDGRPF
ncbi:MAG: hypothetical protein FWC38_00665 [Proteobacteria bacterium]|nr:hypothetical protein [Pseudomonadota bacterium]MCL2306754.1 hypothetical protein [Pseudomonadota bacterium]